MVALGAGELLLTSMDRDGTRQGFDLELTRAVVDAVSIPVIASGGVSSLKDIENLMAIEASGVSGVITGKAVYTGAIKLSEAVALTKGTN